MVAIIHLLVGAVIGASLTSAPAVVITAFFSHYLLDRVPHIDPETFTKKNIPYTWKQLLTLLSDSALTVLVAAVFFFTHKQWALITVGIVASMLPDLLVPLERYTFMTPFRRMHNLLHWDRRYAQQWNWYIAGLVAPAAVGLAASAVLWLTF